jgi:hypothetical protein
MTAHFHVLSWYMSFNKGCGVILDVWTQTITSLYVFCMPYMETYLMLEY